MTKLLKSIFNILFIVIIAFSAICCGEEDPIDDEENKYIPSNTKEQIDNNLGNNYEITYKFSDTNSLDECKINVKMDDDKMLYTLEESTEGNLLKYLVNKNDVHLFSNESGKYVKLPTTAEDDLSFYLIGYELLYEYSSLDGYVYSSVTDTTVANRPCKLYVYDEGLEDNQSNIKIAIDNELGICMKLELSAMVGLERITSTFEVLSFAKGNINLDNELSLIFEEDTKLEDSYKGKTKEEVLASLGSNFKIEISYSDDYSSGTSVVTKDGDYTAYSYITSGGYDDTILIFGDYLFSRRNEENMYFYVQKYDTSDLSTSFSDMQKAFVTLLDNTYEIKYVKKESVDFLGRECTKLFYEEPRPYPYSPIITKEYIIDNSTGFCLKYESSTGFSEEELDVTSYEVKEFILKEGDLKGEVSKIICSNWLSEEQFAQAGLTNVALPNGDFVYCTIYERYDSTSYSFNINYTLSSADDVLAICEAFYEAGLVKNSSDIDATSAESLYDVKTNNKIEFYGKTSNESYIDIECDYNEWFKEYELSIYVYIK